MKLETGKELSSPEPTIRFWLENYGNGSIALVAKHESDSSDQRLGFLRVERGRLVFERRDIHATHLLAALGIEKGGFISVNESKDRD